MNKYIFLDIDGVLNSQSFWRIKPQRERKLEVGYPLCNIDFDAVRHINTITDATDAKIVISSTWRVTHSLEELSGYLKEAGMLGEIIGMTPRLHFAGSVSTIVPRGCEIREWLYVNESHDYDQTCRYAILDDDSDMLYWQRDNYFLCDGYSGITSNIAYRVNRFLNRP